MAWSSLTLPAIFAIIGDNLQKTRRAVGFGVQSILKRVPVVLAPPIGGWLIASLGLASGVKLGLVITIIFSLVAIIIILRYYIESAPPTGDKDRFVDIWNSVDAHMRRLLIADCLARWAGGIPQVFVVLYIMDVLQLDASRFGLLTSIQMLTAILTYIPVAKLSDRMNRKPFILLTFAFFAIFPLSLVIAPSFPWVVLAFVINGLREIGEPARKALIVDMAKETALGRAIGIYYLIRGIVVFPASLIGGWLWKLDHQLPFYVAFLLGIVAFLAYAVWGKGKR